MNTLNWLQFGVIAFLLLIIGLWKQRTYRAREQRDTWGLFYQDLLQFHIAYIRYYWECTHGTPSEIPTEEPQNDDRPGGGRDDPQGHVP